MVITHIHSDKESTGAAALMRKLTKVKLQSYRGAKEKHPDVKPPKNTFHEGPEGSAVGD